MRLYGELREGVMVPRGGVRHAMIINRLAGG
jgi:hypothetical protein